MSVTILHFKVKTKLSGLSSAKTHLTNIDKSTTAIRSMIDMLQADIGSILADIDKSIKSAPSSKSTKTKKKPSKSKT